MKKITKKIVLTLASVVALGTIGVIGANYNPTNATTSVISSKSASNNKKTKKTITAEETSQQLGKKLSSLLHEFNHYTKTITIVFPNGDKREIKYHSLQDLQEQILATWSNITDTENTTNFKVLFKNYEQLINKRKVTIQVDVEIKKETPEVASKRIIEELAKQDSVYLEIHYPDGRETREKFSYQSMADLKKQVLAKAGIKNTDEYEVMFKNDDYSQGEILIAEVDIKKITAESKDQSNSQSSSTGSEKSKKATGSKKADSNDDDKADSKDKDSKKESNSKSDDSDLKSTKKSAQLSTDPRTQEISERLNKQNSVTVVIYYKNENYQKKINYDSLQDLTEQILNLVSKQNDEKNISNYEVFLRNSSSTSDRIDTVYVEVKEKN